MKYALLRLSQKKDHTKYFDLKFKLLNHHFVKKWIDCVLEAQQKQYPISEPWAIYNLNNKMNRDFIKTNINRLMKKIDNVHKLFGFELKNINDQDTLNKIHAIFEFNHGKLDAWKINPLFKNKPDSFRKNLSEINQFIHACECFNTGTKRIRIVWFDLPKNKLFTDEDYDLFTNKKLFGSLYHSYCDVGKNLESLATDNDNDHHDLVPNLHYSADCIAYFNDDNEEETVVLKEQVYKTYIENNKEYVESSVEARAWVIKGYPIDSKKLTTGKVEIAKLETDLNNDKVLEKMKQYDNIQSFFLL